MSGWSAPVLALRENLKKAQSTLWAAYASSAASKVATERAPGCTLAALDRFLVSLHVRASLVYQADTGSNSVSVLGLRSLSNSPRVFQV